MYFTFEIINPKLNIICSLQKQNLSGCTAQSPDVAIELEERTDIGLQQTEGEKERKKDGNKKETKIEADRTQRTNI